MNAKTVEAWYDRYTKSWVVQIKDADGNQVGDADYVHSKAEAMALKKGYEKKIAADEAGAVYE